MSLDWEMYQVIYVYCPFNALWLSMLYNRFYHLGNGLREAKKAVQGSRSDHRSSDANNEPSSPFYSERSIQSPQASQELENS